MTCSKQTRAQIASPDSGNLSWVGQWQQRLHCRACQECRTEQAQIRQIETSLQSLAEASTPPRVYAALLAQLPELSGTSSPTTIHEDVVLDRDGNVRKRQGRRRWAAAAGVILVVGAGSVTTIPRLRDAMYALLTEYYWRQLYQNKALEKFKNAALRDSAPANAKQLDVAKLIRVLWKPWALQHKQEIQAMLGSNNSLSQSMALQREAARNVLQMLPIHLPKVGQGLTLATLELQSQHFTWQPTSKQNGEIPYRLREDFELFHDVVLSRSTGDSNVHYVVWVSGRITAEAYLGTAVMTSQPYHAINPVMREVMPPYEELTQQP